jgi:hypothetical protein
MSYLVQRKNIIGAQMGQLQASINAYDAVTSTAPQISNNIMFLQWLKSVFNRGDGMAAAMHTPTRMDGGGIEEMDMTRGGDAQQGPTANLKRSYEAAGLGGDPNGKLPQQADLATLYGMPGMQPTDILGIIQNPMDPRHAFIKNFYDKFQNVAEQKRRADFPADIGGEDEGADSDGSELSE